MKQMLLIVLISIFTASCASSPKQDQVLHATAWYQNSAEARALFYQAFNVAKLRLDHDLRYTKSKRKRAIVVDVDETIIDNSPYQVSMIEENKPFDRKSWQEWVAMESGTAVPGAVEFLKYAHSRGVEVFYISNRKENPSVEPTYRNLKALGAPVKRENLIFRTSTSDKKARRQIVSKKGYRIVLLIGDQAGDFNSNYRNKSNADMINQADIDKSLFGSKYIVLPNPMYGKWEQALYNYQYKKSEKEKYEARLKSLKSIKK